MKLTIDSSQVVINQLKYSPEEIQRELNDLLDRVSYNYRGQFEVVTHHEIGAKS